tara:strand:- start:866 stop:1570 length:705 start_codon:yes stop_codon:yes gene_type:complete
MVKKQLNQNDFYTDEFLNFANGAYTFDNTPINRSINKSDLVDKQLMLENLKKKIELIDNCEFKNSASKIVFGDGEYDSPIMIVGEAPGEKEDETGKPFVGEAGLLLNKMLNAIKIERENIYITNLVNYRPPGNRKPNSKEIIRYSKYLKEHISIINPRILIIMGSAAMESLFGTKIQISKERGHWKEIIIAQKTYLTMVTFHPAYLLRIPEQKKHSWEDLKKINQKIAELGLKL